MVAPTVIVLVLSMVLLLGLAAVAWRFRSRRGANLFIVLQLLSTIWVLVTIIGLRLPPSPLQLRFWGFSSGMSLVVAVVWFAFILSYTGRENLLRFRQISIIAFPLVVGGVLYAVAPSWSPLVGQVEQTTITAGTVVQAEIGPIGSFLGVYIYLLFLSGLAIIIKTILESSRIFTGQGLALILGSLVTIIASFLAIIGVPTPGYPTTEVALIGQALFWAYAVFGQEFLQVVPAIGMIGRGAIFDDLDDGIVVFDNASTVVRANPTARRYLGMDEMAGLGGDAIREKMDVDTLDALPARFQLRGQTYRATRSPITNWQGETIGQTVVIQDVTSLIRRQQRLQVMNRILRHNVRNDMNVVRGLGVLLQEGDAEDLKQTGRTIEEKTNNLIRISEKAIEFNRIFDSSRDFDQIRLASLVDEIVSPLVDQYPEATIRTDITTEEFVTESRILAIVLEEAVRNAVQHAGVAPEVSIDGKSGPDYLELTITDDGPGIPETEIAPIAAGEETGLEHASSLGLWLIDWGTELLGGDVEFVTSGDGTTVEILVPERVSDHGEPGHRRP